MKILEIVNGQENKSEYLIRRISDNVELVVNRVIREEIELGDEVISPRVVFSDNTFVDLNSQEEFEVVADQVLTQKEADKLKYLSRAEVRDDILSDMAANNMERVRTGAWTVEQLVSLTQDQELKLILDDVNTLSYELAVQKILAASNPLFTEEIKQEYISLLVAHFYN